MDEGNFIQRTLILANKYKHKFKNFFSSLTGETIRFRVVSEKFTETLPKGPQGSEVGEKSEAKSTSPYVLSVSYLKIGLTKIKTKLNKFSIID